MQGEAKFAARYYLSPAMVRTSQVAARLLALRNHSNLKKVYRLYFPKLSFYFQTGQHLQTPDGKVVTSFFVWLALAVGGIGNLVISFL